MQTVSFSFEFRPMLFSYCQVAFKFSYNSILKPKNIVTALTTFHTFCPLGDGGFSYLANGNNSAFVQHKSLMSRRLWVTSPSVVPGLGLGVSALGRSPFSSSRPSALCWLLVDRGWQSNYVFNSPRRWFPAVVSSFGLDLRLLSFWSSN